MSRRAPTVRLAAALAGLAALSPGSSAAEGDRADAALDALRLADRRAIAVFHRLATTNAENCPRTAPSPGWILHDAGQYGERLRDRAAVRERLSPVEPSVAAVAPGAAADRAGVREGDRLVAVQGRAFRSLIPGSASVDRRVGEREAAIAAALLAGAAELEIERAGSALTLRLRPDRACAASVQVEPSAQAYARADSGRVYVSTGMLALTRSDDELAFVLAHELAHVALGHAERRAARPAWRRALGPFAERPGASHDREREADRLGVEFAIRAGYPPEAGVAFWRRRAEEAGGPRRGHPTAADRAAAIEAQVRGVD